VAVKDDLRWCDVLRGDEPVEGCFGILLHGAFSGVAADAATVAAIVKEQDVEAGVVEREGVRECVGDGAVCAVQDERGGSGGCDGVSGGGGDEPAVELREAGGIVGEMEIGEVEADGCWRG